MNRAGTGTGHLQRKELRFARGTASTAARCRQRTQHGYGVPPGTCCWSARGCVGGCTPIGVRGGSTVMHHLRHGHVSSGLLHHHLGHACMHVPARARRGAHTATEPSRVSAAASNRIDSRRAHARRAGHARLLAACARRRCGVTASEHGDSRVRVRHGCDGCVGVVSRQGGVRGAGKPPRLRGSDRGAPRAKNWKG